MRLVDRRPPVAKSMIYPAPIGGWIANRSKAIPRQANLPPGATVLENWFPTATGCRLRKGSARYATVGVGTEPVLSLFTYSMGGQEKLFAATYSTIYDVSNISVANSYTISANDGNSLGTRDNDAIGQASSGQVEVRTGLTGGDWVTTQFTNDGGTFLRGVNGRNTPFVYDGGTFTTTPALTFKAGEQAAPQDLSYVWNYNRRMFFIRRDTLDAYYLPTNAVGGELSVLPLGAVFSLGGSLLFGASWSLGTSGQGGLSSQCVFVTTEGEVAVYAGTNPDSIDTWSLVGVYRIGKPLGKKAFIRAGGDLVISTTIGFMPLSEAVQRDYAALSPAAVSNPIEDAWAEAVTLRGGSNWQAETWSDGQMVVISPPTSATQEPTVFVANANTGAWCRFTGWSVKCFATWRGRLYFGSDGGAVVQCEVGGSDQGRTYTGRYIGLYDDLDMPAARKIAKQMRASVQSSVKLTPKVAMTFDWADNFPSAPNAQGAEEDSVWDSGRWDRAEWDTNAVSFFSSVWQSAGGSGIRMAPTVQITSGTRIPLLAELIAVEATYTVGGLTS